MVSPEMASIEKYRQQLNVLLGEVTPDESLICGILNFVRGRLMPLVIKDINDSVKSFGNNEITTEQQAQVDVELTAESLVEKMWVEFFHPVLRYYQAQHHQLKNQESKHRKKTVELRKVNDKFLKVAKLSRDFFFDLIKQVLEQHMLEFQVPQAVYKFLRLKTDPNAIEIRKSDQQSIIKMLYVVQFSMLQIGATSRYRSSLSQYLSEKNKEDYSKALEMCRYAELLIPAIGEARNQLGLIYQSRDDTFNMVYEFLRSSLARIPSKFGALNYRKMMVYNSVLVEKLNKTIMENNCTDKNRKRYISVYLLAILGFHTQPSWKDEDGIVLVNGMEIDILEKNVLSYVAHYASEKRDPSFFLEQILIMLIGSVFTTSPKESMTSLTSLLRFTFKYIVTLETVFIEQWSINRSKSYSLLPVFRIVVSWLKAQKVALAYSQKAVEFIQASCKLCNLVLKEFPDESFDKRPKRTQYFDEDVEVKEFTPLGRMLWDFDDDEEIFDDPSKLIGRFAKHDHEEEANLRLISVVSLFKTLLTAREGIDYDETANELTIDLSKIVRKKEPKQRSVALTPKSTNKKNKKTKKSKEHEKDNVAKDKEKTNKKNKKTRKDKDKKSNNPGQRKSKQGTVEDSSSDEEDSTELVYHRKDDTVSDKFKPLENVRQTEQFAKPTQIIETHNDNQNQRQMEHMVDSIVDGVNIDSPDGDNDDNDDSNDDDYDTNEDETDEQSKSQVIQPSPAIQNSQHSPVSQATPQHSQASLFQQYSQYSQYPQYSQYREQPQLSHPHQPQLQQQQQQVSHNLYGSMWSAGNAPMPYNYPYIASQQFQQAQQHQQQYQQQAQYSLYNQIPQQSTIQVPSSYPYNQQIAQQHNPQQQQQEVYGYPYYGNVNMTQNTPGSFQQQ